MAKITIQQLREAKQRAFAERKREEQYVVNNVSYTREGLLTLISNLLLSDNLLGGSKNSLGKIKRGIEYFRNDPIIYLTQIEEAEREAQKQKLGFTPSENQRRYNKLTQ